MRPVYTPRGKEDLLSEQTPEVSADLFAGMWRRGTRLVDVREPEEYVSATCQGR